MRVGICGTGKMGSAMAERLAEQGHEITVWNRTRERAQPLIDQGMAFADNPAALAAVCEAVIVIVIDDKAVTEVYEGVGGLATQPLDGTLIIEMSTIRPAKSEQLAAVVAKAGGRYVECPVGGTVQPARNGQLLGLAGGDAADVAKARPLLEQLCRRLEHVGPVGAGAAMKLAVNLPLVVYWEAVGEALAIAESAGIDLAQAADILGDTSGTIKVAPGRLPGIAKAVHDDAPAAAGFSLAGMAKDLAVMSEVAADRHIGAPVADAARTAFETAMSEGWGDREGIMLAAWRTRKTAQR